MQRPKQRSKYHVAPTKDFRSKVADVMKAASCDKHGVPEEVPCYHIPRDTGGYYAGICGSRISQVYNGQIDPQSVSTKRPKKEFTR